MGTQIIFNRRQINPNYATSYTDHQLFGSDGRRYIIVARGLTDSAIAQRVRNQWTATAAVLASVALAFFFAQPAFLLLGAAAALTVTVLERSRPLTDFMQIDPTYLKETIPGRLIARVIENYAAASGAHFYKSLLSSVAITMTGEEACREVKEWLLTLRTWGHLLTKEEASQLDKKDLCTEHAEVEKMQGKDFIEKVARNLELQRIRVPAKYLICEKSSFQLEVAASMRFESLDFADDMYVEKIKTIDSKPSLEEVLELMQICVATGYQNCSNQNILYTEKGFYLMDTEFRAFKPNEPKWSAIEGFENYLIDDGDKKLYKDVCAEVKEAFERQVQSAINAHDEAFLTVKSKNPPLLRGAEFAFDLVELVEFDGEGEGEGGPDEVGE